MNKEFPPCNATPIILRSFCLALLFVYAPLVSAAENNQAPDAGGNWVTVLEPSFLRAPVARLISGSENTLIVAATVGEGEPRRLSTEEFREMDVALDQFIKRAAKNADAILAELKPEFFRDSSEVLTHAVLRSTDPLTCSVLFAPQFIKKFEDLFGPQILVAVPNRNTVYVFPKLAGPSEEFGATIIDEYKNSAWPCSLELFEVSEKGIRATGSYQP